MNRISAAGVEVATASNKYQEGTEQLMTTFFPEIRFVRILGQREGIRSSRIEIIFQCMASVPGIRKEEVVYIGDSDVDMQTGANAGVRAIESCGDFGHGKNWKPTALEIGRKR